MAIASLIYLPPIRRDAVGRTLDYELLETASEQYSSGAYEEAAQTVFRHVLPEEGVDFTKPFSFTQGSSRIHVRIEDGVCFLSVPMVRLPAGGGGVAALRYVLTRINGSGQLHQARLRGDEIHLEFSERLSALHPQKLVETLRRMPFAADQHDDWMESQFGVTPLERAPHESLDDAEFAHAAEIWRVHWDDAEELLKEAQRKRSLWFLNEVTSFTLQRIRFSLPLAGSVLPRLSESANTFNDSDVDPRKRETTMAKCIKDMKAVSADELRKSLAHVSYSISPHTEGTPSRLSNFFGPGNYMETITKYLNSGQSIEAALPLIGTYYYLLATHTWPTEISAVMKEGLAAASGKPWREAATLMLAHAEGLVATYGGDEEGDDGEGEDDDDDDQDDDDEEEA